VKAQQFSSTRMRKRKQGELLGPIYRKRLKKLLGNCSCSPPRDWITFMDATPGGGLIVAKGKDILPEVKKQLVLNLHFKRLIKSPCICMLFFVGEMLF